MTIHIDIGHPAHVHYFKNLIHLLIEKNHKFIVTARDKEITFQLLHYYGIEYISRGKGGKKIINKILYIPYADYSLYKIIKKNKCAISLSFASTYAAHAAKMAGIPHIALDDTEHARFELFLYTPFTKVIFTPKCFTKNLGEKQFNYDSYTELLYLHSKYFKPDPNVIQMLNLKNGEDFAIVRFVSWTASHDYSETGLTNIQKIHLVEKLAERLKVFVSSEGDVPPEIEKYLFKIHPAKIHDALFYSRLYVGEGGTTASEASILGTPAIYINSLSMGYINDEKKSGLLFQTTDINVVYEKIEHILSHHSKEHFKRLANNFLLNKIDPTSFLIWFIQSYPSSLDIIKKNPDYQYNFR